MIDNITSDARRNLVDTINQNGGFRNRKLPLDNPFDELELEGILEYGDPRVFDQQEYSHDSFFRDENNSVHRTHNTLSFSHMNVQKDLKLATQLGGYAMRNRMQRVTRHRSDSGRRKKIYNILQVMPEKYRSVKDHIIQYDLDRLTSLCAGYKSNTVRKICLVMVEDRAISLGMYPPKDELLKIFDAQKTGLMRIKGALIEANMFARVDRRVESMKVAALNMLIELKDLGMIGKMQSLKAQSRIVDLDQFPTLFNGNKHMDFVIAFAALMIDSPHLDLSTLSAKIENLRGMDSRKYYQAMRRAMSRSVDYAEYISTPVLSTAGVPVMVDPIPITAPSFEPVRSVEPSMVPIVEMIEDEPVLMEEKSVPVKEKDEPIEEVETNEFSISWESSDEITNGTWYSTDTLTTYANEWYDTPIEQNDVKNDVRIRRKSGMILLYRNICLINRLLEDGRRRQSDYQGDRPLLVVHNPHVTVLGKGPPY